MVADKQLEAGSLTVLRIEPSLEQSLPEGLRPSELGTQIVIDPARMEALLTSATALSAAAERSRPKPRPGVRPCAAPSDLPLVSGRIKGLLVLSSPEATAGDPTIGTVGVVRSARSLSA